MRFELGFATTHSQQALPLMQIELQQGSLTSHWPLLSHGKTPAPIP